MEVVPVDARTPGGPAGLLAGYRVLDLTRLLPGAHLASLLAGLGAEVVKVESTDGGDAVREMGPRIGAHSSAEWLLTRGRRSVALDLASADGAEACRRLAESCDVVVEGFRPGVADRLGVGFEQLQKRNPRLVFASVTGYGSATLDRSRAGHDLTYVASAGALSPGSDDSAVVPMPLLIADLGGATTAAVGVLAALLHASRTGAGSRVEVSMRDVVFSWQVVEVGRYLATGESSSATDGPFGGRYPCYSIYRCADGRWLAVGALEAKFWAAFCAALQRPDLVGRAQDTNAVAEVAALLATRSCDEWLALFDDVDTCVEAVADVGAAARRLLDSGSGMLNPADPPEGTPVLAVPIRVDGQLPTIPEGPPRLGAHTRTVLQSLAGMSVDEVDDLLARGVAVQTEPE